MSSRRGSSSVTADMAAGAVAGGLSRLAVAPLDLLKIRMQLRRGESAPSLLSLARSIYMEEGMVTFWRGNLSATFLWMSYSSVQFAAFHALRTAAAPPLRRPLRAD